MSGKKEEFQPMEAHKVGMYVCGPTVYDLGHLGHGRSAVSFDIIRKYLIYKGYAVTFVTNYTDIDDKMIKRAEEKGITVPELAAKIIPEYEKDYTALGVMKGDVHPKATDFVAPMINLILKLETKGFVYALDDGIYFDIKKFPAYGKLSKQKLDELKSGARIDVKEAKKNPQDFVLWKFSKPGEPTWESPWGKGRPGWHIECSAMSRELLGESFDIHGGGLDLIFPHHECEIAQSEGAFEKPFAKYWLHNGFININHEKMSKSLGNFFTLRDIFEKFPPQAVRLLFLQTHYRSPIEFSDEVLQQAKNSLIRLHDFERRMHNYVPKDSEHDFIDIDQLIITTRQKFEAGMDQDFDTSMALGAYFDLLKEVNRFLDLQALSLEDQEKILAFMEELDEVLGVICSRESGDLDPEIMQLIQDREKAREKKEWGKSDELRKKLLDKGIILEDTPNGTVWKKV